MLGLAFGALLGWILGRFRVEAAVGAGAGLSTGLGCAMISNAMVMLKDREPAR